MKAIVQDTYGSSNVLRLDEIERPQIGDDDVLVRVAAAGVDPGVWHFMQGLPYLVRAMGLGVRAPKTAVRGTDLAGHVEAVGPNVTALKAGDEVFGACDPLHEGSFAEFARTRADRLAPKPANLSFEQAAAVPVSAVTALQGLRDQGGLLPGQTMLVTGAAGGVGSFAVQIAKALGAEVTGVCSASKTELVGSLGADHVIDYGREDFADGACHYDLILDTAGRRPLSELRHALTSNGTLVIVGGEGGGRWLGGFDRQMVRAPVMSLLGGQKLRSFVAKVNTDDLNALRELCEAGKVTPLIDRTYPLAEVPDAIRYLHDRRPGGKVVVTMPGSDEE